MDHQIRIEQIDASKAASLSALAKAIYPEHYLHLWNEGGADWYMHSYAYPVEKLKNELEDNNVHYCIVYADDEALGYLKLNLTGHLKGFVGMNLLEIERIYLFKKVTGQGLGHLLMEYADQLAIKLNKDLIFLKAMDSSKNAISFYEKNGYTIHSHFQLPMPAFKLMKQEYRGMVILIKKLDKNKS